MMLRPLLLCAFATPAFAECPTIADLSTGVRATLDDGSVETYKVFSSGLVELIANYEDYDARNLLGQGVYVIELSDLEDGAVVPDTRTTSSYPMNVTELPIPEAGARWNVRVALRDSEGFYSEKQSHVWGTQTSVTYGACTYDMIPGEFNYAGDGYSYQEVIHYLPQVGLGLLVSFADEETETPETYTYVSLETLKD